MTANIQIRTVTAADAESVARMWSDFARYLRELGDSGEQNFGVEAFLRDGFGPDPAFSGIIAERGDAAVGYLLYHFGYDTDQAMRVMHVVDLWVDPATRRNGIGRALMREAAARCRAKGGRALIWSVFSPNRPALAFYTRLGGRFYSDLKFMHIAADDV